MESVPDISGDVGVAQVVDPAARALGAAQTLSLACDQVLGAVSAPSAKLDFGSKG